MTKAPKMNFQRNPRDSNGGNAGKAAAATRDPVTTRRVTRPTFGGSPSRSAPYVPHRVLREYRENEYVPPSFLGTVPTGKDPSRSKIIDHLSCLPNAPPNKPRNTSLTLHDTFKTTEPAETKTDLQQEEEEKKPPNKKTQGKTTFAATSVSSPSFSQPA